LLVWLALALLLALPYTFYPPFAAHVPGVVVVVGCAIVVAFAISGWRLGRSPRQIVLNLSASSYLYSAALVAAAYAWGWAMVQIFGFGEHFASAVVVALPALALIASAFYISFVALYHDLGLSPPEARELRRNKKLAKQAKKNKKKAQL